MTARLMKIRISLAFVSIVGWSVTGNLAAQSIQTDGTIDANGAWVASSEVPSEGFAAGVRLRCCNFAGDGLPIPMVQFDAPSQDRTTLYSADLSYFEGLFTLGGQVAVDGSIGDRLGNLEIWSEGQQQRYLVDSDDGSTGTSLFIWYEDSTANSDRRMQLSEGNLQISGSLTEGMGFDLAESFLASGPVESGDLVAVVPGHPRSVRRGTRSSGNRILGVASEEPGIVLGGGAFSVEALEEAWGSAVAEQYVRDRAEIEARVLAENRILRKAAERVSSLQSYEHSLRTEQTARTEVDLPPALPSSTSEEYERARRSFRSALDDRVMARFFEENFVSVALAGRVEVVADTSAGAIAQGDPLAAGSEPGVAVRASSPGPIVGIALEPLVAGRGRVLTLVQRGWYPGSNLRIGQTPVADQDREMARLRERVAELEKLLQELATGEPSGRIARSLSGSARLDGRTGGRSSCGDLEPGRPVAGARGFQRAGRSEAGE